eukprot:TRINITY_DN175_c2_g1_i3.p1 TRINITY_DN175_c2_g1~~TRINITY_DN175_c2_g1_i3.p1  ORF type:complete len:276 (+),score=45.19 TRINITY_DN175_c2_g1_i3:62-889(+)
MSTTAEHLKRKVALLGGDGFVGGYIAKIFSRDYMVVSLSRKGWQEEVLSERPDVLFVCCLVPRGTGKTLVRDFVKIAEDVVRVSLEAGVSVVHLSGHCATDPDGSVYLRAKQAADDVFDRHRNCFTIHLPILFGYGDRLTTDAFSKGSFPEIATEVSFMHVEDAVLIIKELLEDEKEMAKHVNIVGVKATYKQFLGSDVWGNVRVRNFVSPWLAKSVAYCNSWLPESWGMKGFYPYVIEALEQYVENPSYPAAKHSYDEAAHSRRMQQTLREFNG